MCFPIELAPASGEPRPVVYRWDDETSLLAAWLEESEEPGEELEPGEEGRARTSPTAQPATAGGAVACSGSVEIEGRDGSWLTLEVHDGRIDGIAVAVWPRVVERTGLRPPADAELVDEAVRVGDPGQPVATLEVSASMRAEVDDARRTVHFSLGRASRVSEPRRGRLRAVRIARDVLLDVESDARVAGLWLLNVPPESIPAP